MQTFEHGGVLVQLYGPGDRPDEFWQAAGPIFGSAQAQRELGGPFTDSDTTTWTLAVDKWGGLLGLASVSAEGNVALLDHAYVRPMMRRQGIHRALLTARIEAAAEGVQRFRVFANPLSLTALIKLGFIANGKRGKYVTLEADALILRAQVAAAQAVLN